MPLRAWFARSDAQPGAPGLRALRVSREEWRQVAEDVAAAGGRLVALWASPDERAALTIRAAFLAEHRGLVANLRVADREAPYPGLEDLFPAAARMQRALADLSGMRSHRSGYAPLAAPRGMAEQLSAADRSATVAAGRRAGHRRL